jgi:hypothetical protein
VNVSRKKDCKRIAYAGNRIGMIKKNSLVLNKFHHKFQKRYSAKTQRRGINMKWEEILKAEATVTGNTNDWSDIGEQVAKEIDYEGNEKACYVNVDDFGFNLKVDDSGEHLAISVEPYGKIRVIDDDEGNDILTLKPEDIDHTIEIDSKSTAADDDTIVLGAEYYLESFHNGKMQISVVLG